MTVEAAEWYYVDGKGFDHGPFRPSELRGMIKPGMLVWKTGLSDWTKVEDTELRHLLGIRPKHPSHTGGVRIEGKKLAAGFPSILAIFSLRGRATRGEWWLVTFVSLVASTCLVGYFFARLFANDGTCDAESGLGVLALTWIMMGLLTFCVDVRRLHDTNRSGWMLLLLFLCGLVPLFTFVVGVIKFYMLGAQDGTLGPNNYGADPKGRAVPNAMQILNTVVATHQEKDVATRLSELEKLREKGMISETEYTDGRQRILSAV